MRRGRRWRVGIGAELPQFATPSTLTRTEVRAEAIAAACQAPPGDLHHAASSTGRAATTPVAGH